MESLDLTVELERLRRDNAQLQRTISQLGHQVQELGVECNDYREICAAKGFNIEEALAARLHRRMFARLLPVHPRRAASTASEALGVLEISTPHPQNQAESTAIETQSHGNSRQSLGTSLNLKGFIWKRH